MSLTLMDAAFACAQKYAGLNRGQGHREVKAKLRGRFPDSSRSEIARAYAQARALENACYNVGDQCRAEMLTYEQAQAFLAAKFPGFSPETYTAAVSYGMFISR